jgi:hypothetical protein
MPQTLLSLVMEVAVHLDVYAPNRASQSMTILIFVQTENVLLVPADMRHVHNVTLMHQLMEQMMVVYVTLAMLVQEMM